MGDIDENKEPTKPMNFKKHNDKNLLKKKSLNISRRGGMMFLIQESIKEFTGKIIADNIK